MSGAGGAGDALSGTGEVAQAGLAARDAGAAAGVRIDEVHDMELLREISWLFADVWGRTPEGVPMHSESLRAVGHAGGLVSAARSTGTGDLVGAAVLGRDVPGACYSYLTAARPGAGDRGIGRALKQHQRAWAVERGMKLMTWTYDPLVARNGRFNLSVLGALAEDYETAFYGQMSDALNGTDVGDRLVVRWHLTSRRALAAGQSQPPGPDGPDMVRAAAQDHLVEAGPDGDPAHVVAPGERWIRVPTDVVGLRQRDVEGARVWRVATAAWFQDAFTTGHVADQVSRTGWYHLASPGAQEW